MTAFYLQSLIFALALGFLTWTASLAKRNVAIVDIVWSLMFLLMAFFILIQTGEFSSRNILVFSLVTVWALRLSGHLAVRNWAAEEDRRYREIRDNHQPNFEFKSLYLVFLLQAVLAWVVSIPLVFALHPATELGWMDLFAVGLWLVGFLFESISDWQLLKFNEKQNNKGKVLDRGLWRYTRHPNYFGEFCIWWSFYLLAVPSGGWWTIYSPLLMSVLLLRISGIGLMEVNIENRRPAYKNYIARTNAFFPGPPRHANRLALKERA